MTGADALSVSVRIDLADLVPLLKRYREKFGEDLSSSDYQWVNNIAAVSNSSPTIDVLNMELDRRMTAEDFEHIWLAIPEIIDWESIKGFCYTGGKRTIHPDVSMTGYLQTLPDSTRVTVELMKDHRVHCADEEHKFVFKSWPVYRCLYAEVEHEGSKYVLNDGKWYRVDADFVKKTNADFARIPRSALLLPEYSGGTEGKYNADVARQYPETFALLDDKNKIFHGGGHGQVEVCDLLSKDKSLIHIKRYGKSSVLSHLFAQGFVSGRLLQIDSAFRKKVNKKLRAPFNTLLNETKRPEDKEFKIVYGIISDTKGDELNLPFFSRVNLNNTYKTLDGYGYDVQLLKIHVDDSYSKTKICQPQRKRAHTE